MLKQYEVIILGSGISGTLLGTVLARHNVNVAIIDNGTHPRFTIGEATVPETTMNLKIMSELYDVPEIAHLSNFFNHRDRVGSSHGIKKGFSFCYHRENQPHDPTESTQTATLTPPFGPDSHWFRQDTDQYMLTVAARYGVDLYQSTTINTLSVLEDRVELLSDQGDFQAAFVIDGAGAKSPFAKQMELHDTPTQLDTHSRGLFTHMVGVRSWESIVKRSAHGMPYRMDQTTLHHVFDGGWMWVIPFNNHAQATSDICSVGVMFESRMFPKTDLSAEQEFEAFLDRFPSIREQFQSARAIRKWVSSPRIQYSSSRLLQGRYFALPHAAMFIDPLFSTGLVLTTHSINVLADILIDSFAKGELQVQRIRDLETQVIAKTRAYDKLVSRSFKAFRSFELWNAWYRVWEIGTYFNTLGSMRCIMKYDKTGDPSFLRARFNKQYGSPLACNIDGYTALLDHMSTVVDQVESGAVDEAAGVEALYAELGRFTSMPSFITRRERHVRTIGTFTLMRLTRMLVWGKILGPLQTRSYYDFSMLTFARFLVSAWWAYFKRHVGVLFQPVWLMLLGWNPKLTLRSASALKSQLRILKIPVCADAEMEAASVAQPHLCSVAPPVHERPSVVFSGRS